MLASLSSCRKGERAEQAVSRGANERGHGAELRGPGDILARGELAEATGGECDDALHDNEKEKHNDGNFGQTLPQHHEDVLMPVALEDMERRFFDGRGKQVEKVQGENSLSKIWLQNGCLALQRRRN